MARKSEMREEEQKEDKGRDQEDKVGLLIYKE